MDAVELAMRIEEGIKTVDQWSAFLKQNQLLPLFMCSINNEDKLSLFISSLLDKDILIANLKVLLEELETGNHVFENLIVKA